MSSVGLFAVWTAVTGPATAGEPAEPRTPPPPAAVQADPDAAVPRLPLREAEQAAHEGPRYVRAAEAPNVPKARPGPPFYDEADEATFRERFGLSPAPSEKIRRVRMRCLVADPLCGITVEVQALSAYALRARQGSVATVNARTWNSARAQYDAWVLFPAVVRTRGRIRYNVLSIGPKGGVIASDGADVWANFGLAMRAFFGTGAWAPHLEVTGALAFRIAGRAEGTDGFFGAGRAEVGPVRSPAGFTMDVGFGLGGFGSIVVGGQYDSPMAREEIPESLRVPAAGMFYVGFRGNIMWGAPAAAAIGTHVLAGRLVSR